MFLTLEEITMNYGEHTMSIKLKKFRYYELKVLHVKHVAIRC